MKKVDRKLIEKIAQETGRKPSTVERWFRKGREVPEEFREVVKRLIEESFDSTPQDELPERIYVFAIENKRYLLLPEQVNAKVLASIILDLYPDFHVNRNAVGSYNVYDYGRVDAYLDFSIECPTSDPAFPWKTVECRIARFQAPADEYEVTKDYELHKRVFEELKRISTPVPNIAWRSKSSGSLVFYATEDKLLRFVERS